MGAAPGTNTFTTSLIRGTDDGAQDTLVTWEFNITVTAAAPVPEPTAILLLGSGLTGLLALRRQRKGKMV